MHIPLSRILPLSLIYLSFLAASTEKVFVHGEKSYRCLSIQGGHSNMGDTFEATANVLGQNLETKNIDIVFSDLDGTLIHYPSDVDSLLRNKNATEIIVLPPSSTGMTGVISSETLRLIRDIRQMGVKFVLISGMRATTLLKRMPYLPKADAYCCEAGGRIFYPKEASLGGYIVQPKAFMGYITSDLDPFSIVEDVEWRSSIEQIDAAGKDGFVGHELSLDPSIGPVPFYVRQGRLWGFARLLTERGFVIDAQGYSTCFRLNRKQQKLSTDFDRLMNILKRDLPTGLSTSTNLGCIDIYPSMSGKKNCCIYLAKRFGLADSSLPERCICLCDDDNDLEMALGCLHAYIPQITSPSMDDATQLYPTKFTVTSNHNGNSTKATEKALQLVLEKIRGGGPVYSCL